MFNILSRYNTFLTSLFWSSEFLYRVSGLKGQPGASFFKNFSNRFWVGAPTTQTKSTVSSLTDTSSYQLKLVLRKMYLSRSDTFTYLNSSVEPAFTDFVYFFFYKQSKYWYNYRSARKFSNFLGINLIDRIYFYSNVSEWRANQERFLIKKIFQPIKLFTGGGYVNNFPSQVNCRGFNTFEHFNENFDALDNLFLRPQYSYGLQLERGRGYLPFLIYSGAHLPAAISAPFFRLNLKIAKFTKNRVGGVKIVSEAGLLRILDWRTSGLSFLEARLVGRDKYFLNGISAPQFKKLSILFLLPTIIRFSFLLSVFHKLILNCGGWVFACSDLIYIGYSTWLMKIKESRDVFTYLAPSYLGELDKLAINLINLTGITTAFLGPVDIKLGRLVVETLLTPYFVDLGQFDGRVVKSRYFSAAARRVTQSNIVMRSDGRSTQDKAINFQQSYNLLVSFFTFFRLSVLSWDGLRADNLSRLAPLLIYFRRFLKNLGKYNRLLLIFLGILLNRAAFLHLDYRFSQFTFCSNNHFVGNGCTLFTKDWSSLVGGQSNLSGAAAGVTDISYWSLALMRLGGTPEHSEFFALYSGLNLSQFRELSPLKNLHYSHCSMDTGMPLDLEFFDTLSSQIFRKTFDNIRSEGASLSRAFEVDTTLTFAFELQGTWFFNEFDLLHFSDIYNSVKFSTAVFLTFEAMSGAVAGSLALKMKNLKKKRQRNLEQVHGSWTRELLTRIWTDSSPEVLAHKVLIFRIVKPRWRLKWRPIQYINLKSVSSFYWQRNCEFNFFRF